MHVKLALLLGCLVTLVAFLSTPALADGVCYEFLPRQDCGHVGTSKSECEASGCCWNPLQDGSSRPWCYHPTAEPLPSYSVSSGSVKQTSSGFTATLTANSTSTPFGDAISPLALSVTYETNDRVHVKLTDPSQERWEIPEEILPYPPSSTASSAKYNVTYTSSPFSIKVTRNVDGAVLLDTSGTVLIYTDLFLRFSTQLGSTSPVVYGLGEHRDPLRLNSNNHVYTLWAHDQPTPVDLNAYGAHPFFLEVRPDQDARANGFFLRNCNGMDVQISQDTMIFNVIGGVLDMYVFAGGAPEDVVTQYHDTIGHPHMPPFWALGWHQSRYGYPSVDYLQEVVANYSAAKIPLDTMWSDIDHMDAYKDFTFDPTNYPVDKMQAFAESLHKAGQQYVVIIDPAIHNEEGYAPYDTGLKSDVFIKENDNKTVYIGTVWPGSTAYPDFLKPATHTWWATQISDFLNEVPIDGLWIDMNEPSNFQNGPAGSSNPVNNPPYHINNLGSHAALNMKTIPMDSLQMSGTVLHYDAHNLYGMSEAIATANALRDHYGQRAFVLTRSSFAGTGSYAAHWTGDNFSNFDSFASGIRQILAMNMFGVTLVGSDICGFLGNTFEELCARWTAAGAFFPFARNHDDKSAKPQEPYLWESVTQVAQKALGARYALLPYYYTLFYESNVAGGTVARPLFFEFTDDSPTYDIDTQFLIGAGLMVSPVVTQGATTLKMYFPQKARWFSFWTSELQSTNGWQTLSAPLDTIHVHVRGGRIIPMQGSGMTTAESRATPFKLLVATDANGQATGTLFWDDGKALGVGAHAIYTSFSLSKASLSSKVMKNTFEGSSVPPLAQVSVLGVHTPVNKVTVNGQDYSSFSYNASTESLIIHSLDLAINAAFTITYA